MNRNLRTLVIIGSAIACVLMFLLASASSNSQVFVKYYKWLLAVNAVAALALLALVGTLAVRLVQRLRHNAFGARLMARFAIAFALMGVVPGALIYVISSQFLARTIDSWFDVPVENALRSGLNLGRATADQLLIDLTAVARDTATELLDVPDVTLPVALARARERTRTQELLVFTASGRTVAFAGSRYTVLPDIPPAPVMQQVRATRNYAVIEGFVDDNPTASADVNSAIPGDLRLRVVVPLGNTRSGASGAGRSNPAQGLSLGPSLLSGEQRFLQIIQTVPTALSTNIQSVKTGSDEYRKLSDSRPDLRRMYGVILTMALLLAAFASIAIAVALAQWMARPLLRLAEGTRDVAQGNFRQLPSDDRKDELGALTASFNAMTNQLSDAQRTVQQKQTELSQANMFMQGVLDNLSSGVLVCDPGFVLRSSNPGAQRILGMQLEPYFGHKLGHSEGTDAVTLVPFEQEITQAFAQHAAQDTQIDHWQRQFELPRANDPEHKAVLLARGCWLDLPAGRGTLIVFDDITEVVSVQRATAWGEVARRLAHEIKNPLTPIQLAAERMQIKLQDHLQPDQANLLERSTNVIINQVASMKRLVDDFREYARTPPAQLHPLELNTLVLEVLALYGWDSSQLSGSLVDRGVRFELNLSAQPNWIEGDATQLRQVIHNLINNAQDALRLSQDNPAAAAANNLRDPVITISTTLISAAGGQGHALRLNISDTGPGFAAKLLQRAFEPYVTTKPSGTGLGLAIVKKIIEEHGARIDLANRLMPNADAPGQTHVVGASVSILFPVVETATTPAHAP